MPTPAAKPSAEATTPTTKRLGGHRRTTCRRDAPIARSSADSRVRWATRIENVLWMLNVATTSAMPAKASRNVSKKSEEVVADVVFLLGGELGAGQRLESRRAARRRCGRELLLASTPSLGAHDDATRSVRRAEQQLLGASSSVNADVA